MNSYIRYGSESQLLEATFEERGRPRSDDERLRRIGARRVMLTFSPQINRVPELDEFRHLAELLDVRVRAGAGIEPGSPLSVLPPGSLGVVEIVNPFDINQERLHILAGSIIGIVRSLEGWEDGRDMAIFTSHMTASPAGQVISQTSRMFI